MQVIPTSEQKISKFFQRPHGASYRFGDFQLHPEDRVLKQADAPLPLSPKAFDALLFLVRRAERLVTKRELIEHLWPDTHVTEANLTNTIGLLRRAIGRKAIATVSKHGYRFNLVVEGQPGIRASTYTRFLRARELTLHRSLESTSLARELYWICLAEEPDFAEAWAWLGRCCWFLGKFRMGSTTDYEMSSAAFDRAFSLDPDLACAHQFYTPVETDSGDALRALVRLRDRLRVHADEAESLAGMVQVMRFCGLPERSLEAARRVEELDPTLVTSMPHTLFLLNRYPETVEAYSGRTGYYLDAAAWAAMNNTTHAAVLLRERLARGTLSDLLRGLMESLLAAIEGRHGDALACMRRTPVEREPEVLFYLARHYSFLGAPNEAVAMLHRAMAAGFVPAPCTLRCDPWLSSVRTHEAFEDIVAKATATAAQADGILQA